MPERERSEATPEPELPDDLRARLDAAGIADQDEAALRRTLERHVPGYNLFRLTPAAAGIVYGCVTSVHSAAIRPSHRVRFAAPACQ